MSDRSAARRWAAALGALAIPPEILARAPESPYGFPVALFERAADRAAANDSPSRRCAAAALPPGGSILDVGCGAGAASLPLAPIAARIVGVDESAALLEAFARRASEAGVDHAAVHGRWPDVADSVEPADVVVCHHVFYNVADLAEFASALTEHARRIVVVELTAVHPLAWLAPLWRELHGLDRPDGPRVEDAEAVLAELGLAVDSATARSPFSFNDATLDEQVEFVRRRLCVSNDRDGEIRVALDRHPVPVDRALVTLSWSGSA